MNIKLKEITIREVVEGYKNNNEEGVSGFNGVLNIRPKYQREFVYKSKQRDAVINTVIQNFPLNTMYWVKSDNGLEVLDGQQRTISVCEYIEGNYSIENKEGNRQYFFNLSEEEQEQILNYKLMIYFCEGSDKDKLDWFHTINIAGERLTKQELRNAVYTGTWLSDAKRYFSKTNCAASNIGGDYIKGSPIRQEILETAIEWISNDNIEEYMASNQLEANAQGLWSYFQEVIEWIETTFPKYRAEMKGVNWGELHNKFKDTNLNPEELEAEVAVLMADEEVTKKQGIYKYVLTREEKYLSVRVFSKKDKTTLFARQDGVCPCCSNTFKQSEMEADHIVPWSRGGKTDLDNGQILCRKCNNTKSDR